MDDISPLEGAVVDPGLSSLTLLLRFHSIAVNGEQLCHPYGTKTIGISEMLRCAKQFGLKAKSRVTTFGRLANTPLPAIGQLRDGGFVFIAKADAEKILLQLPNQPRPVLMKKAQFEAVWNGHLGRFDIGWFLQAIQKYKRLLAEVLIASFFLQMFGLVSPLIFQVVIDKVLVHQNLSTLDVLMVALVAISVFEAVLSVLRTYVFSHTTNRIDVELGARLFRHLLALPLAYFQTRRAGDSVARVRELENIRNFLTSSALTLTIDLFFTVVFVAIMFLYSTSLTWVVLLSLPFYAVISIGLTPAFRRRLNDKFRLGADNQSFLVESLTGVETLKAMAVEPQMQRRWEDQLAAYVGASFRVLSLANAASNGVQLISKLVTAAILFIGAKLVIDGDLSVGELVAFNIMAGRVSAPILRLAQIWQDFHQTRISVERLGDILNSPTEPSQSASRAALPTIRGEIIFDRVNFRYRIDGQPILQDMSFKIEPGQFVARSPS